MGQNVEQEEENDGRTARERLSAGAIPYELIAHGGVRSSLNGSEQAFRE